MTISGPDSDPKSEFNSRLRFRLRLRFKHRPLLCCPHLQPSPDGVQGVTHRGGQRASCRPYQEVGDHIGLHHPRLVGGLLQHVVGRKVERSVRGDADQGGSQPLIERQKTFLKKRGKAGGGGSGWVPEL